MKKKLIILFALLSLFSCQGKSQNINEIKLPITTKKQKINIKNMEVDTIYKKQHKHLTLLLTREADSVDIKWQLILLDKNQNELVLDTIHKKRSPMWQEVQKNYGYTQLGHYTISASYLKGTDLFVIYQDTGNVMMSKYSFIENGQFVKEDRFVQKHFQEPSISENAVISTILDIDNNLYVNIQAKLSRLGTEQSLYKINLSSSFFVKKIVFKENYKIIKPYHVKEAEKESYQQYKTNIEWYDALSDMKKEQEKSVAPSDRDRTYVKNIENYFDMLYYYKEMSRNKEESRKEDVYLDEFSGLTTYSLFGGGDSNEESSNPLDKSKIKNAKKYLEEVLNTFGDEKITNQFELLSYIYQSKGEYNIFFFYRNDSIQTKIARYNNALNEWYLGGYNEEEIKEKKSLNLGNLSRD